METNPLCCNGRAVKIFKHFHFEKFSITLFIYLLFIYFLFNFFFQLTAVVILTLGLWIRYDWDFKHYILELHLYQFWTGVYILIAAASIVMALSFIGCCGTITENPTILGLVKTNK